ncbi:hypothetical protein SAMN04487891_109164 [Flagellimonas taeanensis]|uniref:Uncharacterized protein n=1 Tax=Flagellimonas taeanensis TaxID=1005926 RepID=A0A1M7ATS3_9FLAO|nr:hypothetical protein SAMN04487891_109164 [Allomuricauda taeanensis]SHL46061.1 hypothetical protein SAMN05216293_3537 [Allomuricauda taeanensis]
MWEGIVSILVGFLTIIIIKKSKKEIGKGDYEGSFNFDTKGYIYAIILIIIGIYILYVSI